MKRIALNIFFTSICILSGCKKEPVIPDASMKKTNPPQEVGTHHSVRIPLNKKDRYLFVADYTKPAGEGYIPFCLLDIQSFDFEELETHVSFGVSEINTLIDVHLDFFKGGKVVKTLNYSKTTVPGLTFKVEAESLKEPIGSACSRIKHAEYSKLYQSSTIYSILSSDLEEMKKNAKISMGCPFWKWEPKPLIDKE